MKKNRATKNPNSTRKHGASKVNKSKLLHPKKDGKGKERALSAKEASKFKQAALAAHRAELKAKRLAELEK